MQRTLLIGASLIAAAGASPAFARKAIVVVGGCEPHPQYATIQSAIDSVPAGSQIDVCPGTYPEQLTITKALTIQGVADNDSTLATITFPQNPVTVTDPDTQSALLTQVLVQNTAGVTLKNLTFDGSGNNDQCAVGLAGVTFQNSSATLANSSVLNTAEPAADFGCQTGFGIYVENPAPQTGEAPAVTVKLTANLVQGFQKDGILVTDAGITAMITGNTVTGAGPTPATAQNGIEVDYGTHGTITGNHVTGNVYTGPYYGASGILIYDAPSASIKLNTVSETQLGIVVEGDQPKTADKAEIASNTLLSTYTFDAIDVCGSNNNAITGNTITGAGESGVHLDSECGVPSTGNTVTGNKVSSTCAAFLVGTGSNAVGQNDNPAPLNAGYIFLPGDSCPVSTGASHSSHKGMRAAPSLAGRIAPRR